MLGRSEEWYERTHIHVFVFLVQFSTHPVSNSLRVPIICEIYYFILTIKLTIGLKYTYFKQRQKLILAKGIE